MKNKNLGGAGTHATLAAKKQAKYLIVRKGLSAKEVAQQLKRTEKTIGEWIKKYGWGSEGEKILYETKMANSLQDFMTFVSNKYPHQYEDLQFIHNDYLNLF